MSSGNEFDPSTKSTPFDVAVIGGGIIGVQVALGLIQRNIPVIVYEQMSQIREIGAGISFVPAIVDCMRTLHPAIAESLDKTASKNDSGMAWIDGRSKDIDQRPRERLFDAQISRSDGSFAISSCHRAQFLNQMLKHIPTGQLRLGKRAEAVVRNGTGERYTISFTDGTSEEASCVIACDGIKSRIRQIVLGNENPESSPHYAHELAYRCLIDMSEATRLQGQLAEVSAMYVGEGACLITYPVAHKKQVNLVAFTSDNGEWPAGAPHATLGEKKDVVEAFSTFGPTVRKWVDLLPDRVDCWAMFDTYDYPLSTYAYDGIVLAGDAAHASTPHHGFGASSGVEDALTLVTLLNQASTLLMRDSSSMPVSSVLTNAFRAYDSARRLRSQWVVACSRTQGMATKLQDPDVKGDFTKMAERVQERAAKMYFHNWKHSLQEAQDEMKHLCGL